MISFLTLDRSHIIYFIWSTARTLTRSALENFWPDRRAIVDNTNKWLLSRVKKDNIVRLIEYISL